MNSLVILELTLERNKKERREINFFCSGIV